MKRTRGTPEDGEIAEVLSGIFKVTRRLARKLMLGKR